MAEIVAATAGAVGAVRGTPEVNRPPGVVYAKCVLTCALSGAWVSGAAYIIGKYNADPQLMINIFQNIALPSGVLLIGISAGCLKLSLRADSLSSLKELWKRYTQGVLQNDLRQALLTPDLLHFAEAGQNVELEVQIDERVYQEACLDLMVKTVLQANQNGENTSLSSRRSLSESNLAVYSSKIKDEFQQANDEPFPVPTLTWWPPRGDSDVHFLNIDDEKVFEMVGL